MKFDMRKIIDSMKTRSFRVGGFSIIAAVIVLAIAIAANWLVSALPADITRIDTTVDRLTGISQQTENIVRALDQDVTLYWVVQEGQEDATLRTMLERYQSLSSHIQVVKKAPDTQNAFVQQYTSGDIYNNSVIVESGDRYRYVSYEEIYVYDTANYYVDGTYTVTYDGESALTSAIDYVVSKDIPKVYMLSGHGEASLPATYATAVERENVELVSLSLLTEGAVPADADAVLVCAPQSDISGDEKGMLEAYLAAGGRMLLITNPPQDGPLTNLEALMAGYGVTAAEGVVVESSSGNYALNMPYYLLPTMTSHDITLPLKENGYSVMLPVSQGLTVSDDKPENVDVRTILYTSVSAFSKLAGYNMTTYEKEEGDIEGPFFLAVDVTGGNADGSESKIIWVSSAALLDEQTNARVSGGNQDFFLNALNYLAEPETSNLTIRAKTLSTESLTVDSAAVSILSTLTMFVIPLAYLAVGIVVWVKRKRR